MRELDSPPAGRTPAMTSQPPLIDVLLEADVDVALNPATPAEQREACIADVPRMLEAILRREAQGGGKKRGPRTGR